MRCNWVYGLFKNNTGKYFQSKQALGGSLWKNLANLQRSSLWGEFDDFNFSWKGFSFSVNKYPHVVFVVQFLSADLRRMVDLHTAVIRGEPNAEVQVHMRQYDG